jgi:putative transposase
MKQTMHLKLAPTPEQHAALLETMHAFNEAANYVASVAFASQTANTFELQKVVYGDLCTTHTLPAQLAIRAIGKVSEAYTRDKSIQPHFRPEGAVVYGPRVMAL